MSNKEVGRSRLDVRAKVIIVFALCASFLVAFIPIWQLGVSTSIRYQTYMAQEKLDEFDREDRALKASISEVERESFKSDLYQILAGV